MPDDTPDSALDPLDAPKPSASLNLRKRLEELGQMALLVFILGSAAFLSAITAMRIAIHGREVTMPNLTGKSVTEANNMLHSRGLVLKVADRVYSELPINVVVRQTPPAGLLMKESQQAHVVLSLGQRQLQIPLLEGNSLRASRIELPYVMPHFVGMLETDAQRRLDAAGLRRKVNYVTAPQWPHGAVIDQSPLAGSRLPAISTIDLTVAN